MVTLTHIPQGVTANRMGRKPIKKGVLMKPLTYYFDPEAMARVEALVGKKKISEFLRAAIERELKWRAKQNPIKEAAEEESCDRPTEPTERGRD